MTAALRARAVAGRLRRSVGRRLSGEQPQPVRTVTIAPSVAVGPAPGSAVDADPKWLEVVAGMAPIVIANRDVADATRRLPTAITDALIAADLGRMMVPRSLGGHEASLTTAVRVVEALARLDGSTGWNAWVMTGHGRIAEYLAADAARDVFGSPSGVLAGSITASGRAEAEPGGYRLWGRWAFGSATAMADYIAAGAMVFDRGVMRRGPDGNPDVVALVVPKQQCDIDETWHTTGLRGTASNDVVVDGVFVPAEFTFAASAVWTPLGGSARYGRPYGEFAPVLMAAVAVGVASDAIDAYREYAATKSLAGDGPWTANLPIVHQRIGEALAIVESARSHLYATTSVLDALGPGDPDRSLDARRAGAHIAERAADATALLYRRGGSGAIYEHRRLERCYRDVGMVAQHGLISASAYVDSGRASLAPEG